MTGRTRALLIALGVAVAALVIWKVRGNDAADAPSTATGPGSTASSTGPGQAPPSAIDPRSGATITGGPDEPADPAGAGSDRETRTYVMDNGAVVRDHRGAGYDPPINPPPMRPDQRTMNTQITARIYQELAPLVAACGARVPAGDRGADPFVYVTMTVKVAKGQLTTTDVYPTLHDVNGGRTASFTDCVADKAKAIALASGAEPDHDDYIVQYPIRIR